MRGWGLQRRHQLGCQSSLRIDASTAASASCHVVVVVVVVVDASGSMRKHDVPGPNGCISRISAVYDCVERELLAPQLQLGPAVSAMVIYGSHLLEELTLAQG
ncbi:hypothetical protein CHLRE_09g404552v5 [Chlamydomonas reinhardtii]|uniref:VWFA domain-containing protein n=1 Tax=Chlamydomonas reinhardtii TaxID=3055 RepID=A0A2K3DCK8_CHLRE|nr:uncharacterized protein CHLRE_09g404552v5 [Chlamydomonas reinhardtii]PNW78262.1 hypothetical protein CHLRE_09g404552v5 [Chlamydomonas reinhardtii]